MHSMSRKRYLKCQQNETYRNSLNSHWLRQKETQRAFKVQCGKKVIPVTIDHRSRDFGCEENCYPTDKLWNTEKHAMESCDDFLIQQKVYTETICIIKKTINSPILKCILHDNL